MDDVLADAVQRLLAAGARDELLVDVVQPRWFGVRLPLRMEQVERVWRLGVVLLGRSGKLYSTGTTLRVSELRHSNAQSRIAEDRREIRAVALRSGIAGGETINLDAVDIALDALTAQSRPVARTADGLVIQWSPASDALAPLAPYVNERVELLIHPPDGA